MNHRDVQAFLIFCVIQPAIVLFALAVLVWAVATMIFGV